MRAWLWMLGGLLIWAAHFTGVYALASAADVLARADDRMWRAAGGVFSLICLGGLAILSLRAARRLRQGRMLIDEVALGGALAAMVAVSWQSLPLVVGH